MATERTYPHKTHVVGRLVIGPGRQGAGAPIVDSASTVSIDGWTAGSLAIRLRRTPGPCLIVGWIGRRPPAVHKLGRLPVLGALFRIRP